MHDYQDIMPRAVAIVTGALSDSCDKITEELQTSGATRLVKSLQAIEWAKTCFAVGLVSTFEAYLKSEFDIAEDHAFKAAQIELAANNEHAVAAALKRIVDATNALKHGDGKSYRALLAADPQLDFKVKADGQAFFEEGDVSEISTLVFVDDDYLSHCEEVLLKTLQTLRNVRQTTMP